MTISAKPGLYLVRTTNGKTALVHVIADPVVVRDSRPPPNDDDETAKRSR